MKTAMIARADNGGLGAASWEYWRAMEPDRTLLIDLGARGRGRTRLERYPGALVNCGMDNELSEGTVRHLCRGIDVLYVLETLYRSDVADIARSVDCATVVHVMPELRRADLGSPTAEWIPTVWLHDRMPQGTKVVPVPVATDRLPYRPRTEAVTFLHIAAPAFHDRNGTRIVIEALSHVTRPCKVIIAGASVSGGNRIGVCQVEWRNEEVEDYWQRYSDDIDVLLLPRRYGGLSLPMQEAAACGIPVVTLDLDPQNRWVPKNCTIPARPHKEVRMAGGDVSVHDADPAALAAVMDRLIENPKMVTAASKTVGAHGMSLSWDRWAPRYRELLEEVALAQ